MSEEITIWNKVMKAAMSMPGVKVNRDSFLKKELLPFCTAEDIQAAVINNPVVVISKEILDKVANSCINNHTVKVTAISTVSGIPGGLTMAATIPADIAQYYWHVFVVAQKMAYLYGYPDLCDEDGDLSESSMGMLTVFTGIMMGAAAANQAIKQISQQLAKQVVKRLPQKALTKTTIYPIIKQVAKWIGIKLTKQSFSKALGKVIPVLGGVISGGITLATFRPSAKRLQKQLQEGMVCFKGQPSYATEQQYESNRSYDAECQDVEFEVETPSPEMVSIKILINIAKIDHDLSNKQREYLDDVIETSSLTDDEQLELASSYKEDKLFDIDYEVLKGDDMMCIDLFSKMKEISELDGKMNLAEKLYIRKIKRELGYDFGQSEENNL